MIDRIHLILKTKNLTPTLFADSIGIQRSGLSHLLSGRNNPSLDFIQKVLTRYPDIEPDWLLFGKGSMYRSSNISPSASEMKEEPIEKSAQTGLLFDFSDLEPATIANKPQAISSPALSSMESTPSNEQQPQPFVHEVLSTQNPEIERIIILFKNGEFKVYSM